MKSYQCMECKNYQGSLKCKAFPDGIPKKIVMGMFDHEKPYPNEKNRTDKGITFKNW